MMKGKKSKNEQFKFCTNDDKISKNLETERSLLEKDCQLL